MKIPSFFTQNEIALAYYLASKSFKEGTNIARDFDKEFLLYLAGKRDINKAKEYVFSKKGSLVEVRPSNLTLPLDWRKIERISLSRL